MAWTIEYAETAKKQLRKLDKAAARRIADFMDKRIGAGDAPLQLGKALQGPLGNFWCYRVDDFRMICDIQDRVLTVLVLQIGNRREVYRR